VALYNSNVCLGWHQSKLFTIKHQLMDENGLEIVRLIWTGDELGHLWKET